MDTVAVDATGAAGAPAVGAGFADFPLGAGDGGAFGIPLLRDEAVVAGGAAGSAATARAVGAAEAGGATLRVWRAGDAAAAAGFTEPVAVAVGGPCRA
jgi:hypothetical protein